MSEFDIKNFDFKNLKEDEDSEEILKEIIELKRQNLTNNIDFEKAEEERKELEEKLERERKEKESSTKKDEHSISKNEGEELTN